jgi:hypothetical protein
VVPTISFRLLYGFLVLRHSRREILWLGVTARIRHVGGRFRAAMQHAGLWPNVLSDRQAIHLFIRRLGPSHPIAIVSLSPDDP